MQKILLCISLLTIVACGGEQKTGEKKSRLLTGKLKNTSWSMPGFEAAGLSIYNDGKGSVSMSESSFISNATISVLEEDPKGEFVVFNLYDETGNNRVLGVSVVDKDTIRISIISSSNSLEGYKAFHDSPLGVEFKRAS